MAGRRSLPNGLIRFLCCALLSSVVAAQGQATRTERKELFQTSDRCFACHNTLSTRAGEDISIGTAWRATMMANSARDPYWQASVRRELIDHPGSQKAIEEECSKCHMPMASLETRASGGGAEVFAHLDFASDDRTDRLARDGVSCSLCHQIRSDRLGTREGFVGGFVIDTTVPLGERQEFGPFAVENGENRIMRTSSGGYRPTEGQHIRQSELCATCHTLITSALGPGGEKIGDLPEQMPFQEWFSSDFRDRQSCQTCHMPVVEEPVRMASTLGKFREGVSRHVFVGGNFFMLRMLNRHRDDLDVWALPQELEASAAQTIEHLESKTARVSIDQIEVAAGRLQATVSVQNLSGHKFPTGYPSRRAWLHVTVKDAGNRVVFDSGRFNTNGSIAGNDNDSDGTRFEPHQAEITSPDEVQIYEDIMVGIDNAVTTGLLTAVRFVKDNRLLPAGFNKRSVDETIAPQGGAREDEDFTGGGDTVRYLVALDNAQGPFRVDAELWFQPIAYRWASNLRAYDAMEPQRLVRYYEEMSSGSAIVIARAAAASRTP